ncbi:hypothetical protein [Hymenobacter metallicola]|uniref:Lipoprotein n=1 Tax=Hymenobacter metallicola TaxID=2563114 RepID=A0A4Z0QEM2_9BACT|nr:hypothetical protein [Hymenobacter metallicola]TGE28195.1 hypothetical protein E5K02_01655 [Hymenobacter metallicola]
MKSTLLFLTLTLVGSACQKTAIDPEAAPQDFAVDFNKDFGLHHRQQATLPATSGAELTLRLEELHTSFCPEGMMCIVGPSAWPVLTISDANGQQQQLTLPKNQARTWSGTWLDTASIRANGRRYLLTYTQWDLERVPAKGKGPAKADWVLWFHVDKANR